MKALVKYALGEGNMEIREVPEPAPSYGQVKIRIKRAGICGSDIHIYHNDIEIPIKPAVITGHEFSGVVEEVGEGVSEYKAGDRVTSETAYSFCGECPYCRTGYYNLCDRRRTLGYWYDGVFADYTVVPKEKIRLLPDNVDFDTGAAIEPLACVVNAVLELTQITEGEVVLVSGPGSIGLIAMQVAKACGAKVIVTGKDNDADRLEKALELGTDYAVNIDQQDINGFVGEITGELGVDVVLECSGNASAINLALDLIKKQGKFTQIGLLGKPAMINFDKICYKELKVTGSLGSKGSSWDKAIEFLKDEKVILNTLVTDRFYISDWRRAFEKFENREGIKLMMIPESEREEKGFIREEKGL